MDSGTAARPSDRHKQPAPLVPPEFLRVIAVWSLVPAYMLAGAFLGWLAGQAIGGTPYLIGIGLLVALILAVRDMMRLREEWM